MLTSDLRLLYTRDTGNQIIIDLHDEYYETCPECQTEVSISVDISINTTDYINWLESELIKKYESC